MGSMDKWILGAAGLVGIAALMWYGDREVKNASETFAKNLSLPSFNFAPNVALPNISIMPNISTPDMSGLFGFLQNSQQYKDYNSMWDALNKALGQNLGTPIGGTYPIVGNTQQVLFDNKVISQYDNTSNGLLPNIFGGLMLKNDTAVKQPTKTTSQGGNGIFVENVDNDYLAPDSLSGYAQHLVGGTSNPYYNELEQQLATKNTAPASITSIEDNIYNTKGYSGTVSGYRDVLNSQIRGAGDKWLNRIKDLDANARRMEFGF